MLKLALVTLTTSTTSLHLGLATVGLATVGFATVGLEIRFSKYALPLGKICMNFSQFSQKIAQMFCRINREYNSDSKIERLVEILTIQEEIVKYP